MNAMLLQDLYKNGTLFINQLNLTFYRYKRLLQNAPIAFWTCNMCTWKGLLQIYDKSFQSIQTTSKRTYFAFTIASVL